MSIDWCDHVKKFNWQAQMCRLELLSLKHLPDLEDQFDPSLFDYYPKPYSTAREFVNENLEMVKHGDYVPFVIISNKTSRAVGCTEYSSIDHKNRKLEVGGSWLKRSVHGSPINSEAKLLMLTNAFEGLDFVRVHFTANALNAQSRAGIERIGGKFEGIIRNAKILPDGTLRNDAYYSVIASEWPDVKKGLVARIKKKYEKYGDM